MTPRDPHTPEEPDWPSSGASAADDAARDRMLEYALESLHEPGAAAPDDLPRRVRQAWERGERGVNLQALDLDRDPLPVPVPVGGAGPTSRAWSWTPRRAAALAALALGATLLGWRLFGPGTGHPGPTGGQDVADGAPSPDRPQDTGGDSRPLPAAADPRIELAAELSAEKRDTVAALLELQLRDLAFYSELARAEMERGQREELLLALGDDRAAWAELDLRLEARLQATSPSEQVWSRLVALARSAPRDPGDRLGRALYLQRPQAFRPADLTAFADRGHFEFQRDLVSMALDAPDFWEQDPDRPDLIAAAWLLNRGDRRALARLEDALDELPLRVDDPRRIWRVDTVLLVGSLLAHAEGGDAWERAHARANELVEALLARDDLEGAALTAVATETFRAAEAPPAFPLTTYPEQMRAQAEKRAVDLGDAESIRTQMLDLAVWPR